LPQLAMQRQLAELRTQGLLPGALVGGLSPVAAPLRPISRLIVDADRPNALAIARTDRPATMPLEISSRSTSVKARTERRRAGGLMPPLGLICAAMLVCPRPSTWPIACSPSPRFQRSHNSALSAAVTLVLRYFRLIAIAPRPHIKVRVALTG
jgi:hypothetical protein